MVAVTVAHKPVAMTDVRLGRCDAVFWDDVAPGVLARILSGEPVGTYFVPKADRLGARKRWIAFAVAPQGRLAVDAGAATN